MIWAGVGGGVFAREGTQLNIELPRPRVAMSQCEGVKSNMEWNRENWRVAFRQAAATRMNAAARQYENKWREKVMVEVSLENRGCLSSSPVSSPSADLKRTPTLSRSVDPHSDLSGRNTVKLW